MAFVNKGVLILRIPLISSRALAFNQNDNEKGTVERTAKDSGTHLRFLFELFVKEWYAIRNKSRRGCVITFLEIRSNVVPCGINSKQW